MSRRKKALVRELHRAIDDWHLFMDDAKGNKDETACARRDINKARRSLFDLKRKNIDAEDNYEECCVF